MVDILQNNTIIHLGFVCQNLRIAGVCGKSNQRLFFTSKPEVNRMWNWIACVISWEFCEWMMCRQQLFFVRHRVDFPSMSSTSTLFYFHLQHAMSVNNLRSKTQKMSVIIICVNARHRFACCFVFRLQTSRKHLWRIMDFGRAFFFSGTSNRHRHMMMMRNIVVHLHVIITHKIYHDWMVRMTAMMTAKITHKQFNHFLWYDDRRQKPQKPTLDDRLLYVSLLEAGILLNANIFDVLLFASAFWAFLICARARVEWTMICDAGAQGACHANDMCSLQLMTLFAVRSLMGSIQ